MIPQPDPNRLYQTLDLIELAGVTYMQVNVWSNRGWLIYDIGARVRDAGRGNVRRYRASEVAVARGIRILVEHGIGHECAARIARAWVQHPGNPVAHIGAGITVRLSEVDPDHPHQAEYVQATETLTGGRVLHTDVICARDEHGMVSVDWRGNEPGPGDMVLMSYEMFCNSVDAINVEATNRRNRVRVPKQGGHQ